MLVYLVQGGDAMADRMDAVGVYSTMKEAEKAAENAARLVKDGKWFGCHIIPIRLDQNMKRTWSLDSFTGWRNTTRTNP
jgi:hypothetical protein